jgi:DNA-binding IclR family transcriptional regulator
MSRKSKTGTKLTPPRADETTEKGGVQSVEVGMKVLKVLADSGGAQNLSRIAESAGIHTAKAHRYLTSLMRSGFVDRESKTNRYVLGPEALRVGLVALARTDVVDVAGTELDVLRDKISATLLLAVWSRTGPTIVRWVESGRPVTVNVRAGSHMPVLKSATGQVFAAFLPPEIVQPFIEAELVEMKRQKLPVPSVAEIKAKLDKVRKVGLGHTAGEMLPGVLALAAPIFNYQREIVGVVAALGPKGFFNDSFGGETARELRSAAASISERLGSKNQ